jgi:cobalt/nickel transport system permease protein
MSCSTHFTGHTIMHRLDPRPRIVTTLVFAVFIALSGRYRTLCGGLAVGALLALLARLPVRPLTKRLLRVNGFMLLLVLLLPLSSPGAPLFAVFHLPFSREGLRMAMAIALKANAMVLAFTALLGTVELTALGHAFQHLRVPDKLIHLFLFTLRYLDVLHHAYLGLLRAMKARAFRPRMNLHTYRSYGSLMAMLLVRSIERAERVMDAMKCRGFKGRFLTYRHVAFHRRDAVFCLLSALAMLLFAWMEWIPGGGPP